MTTHLKDLNRRVDRARKHLEDFERQATHYRKSMQKKVVTEIDTDGVNQFKRYKVKGIKEPPLRLSFIAGDCIHNLRSTLDNLVWQLGVLSECPIRKLGDLSFPSTRFDAWKEKFHCLPQSAIDLIGSLQPDKPYQGRDDPDLHPLRILHRLWNDDKHRSPTLMLVIPRSVAVTITGPMHTIKRPNGRLVRGVMVSSPVGVPIRMSTGGRLQDGQTIITIPFGIGEPEPQLKAMVSFDITFDKGGPARGQLASKCLRNLHDFVRDEVLAPFESIFPK